jgi:hypothetical protein
MLPRTSRALALVAGLTSAALLLTGRFLRSMFGNTIIVEDIAEEVDEIITTVFSDSTAAVCVHTNFGFYDCTYILDGEVITSTFYLVSEFGLTGVLLDPLIVQVPSDVISVTATYDAGSGPQPAVTQARQSFEMLPHQPITAEAGTQFLIFEFPASVVSTITATDPISGPHFDFALNFTQIHPISQPVEPVSVKAMFTGKVVARGHVYYAPLLPCVTSFTDIPSVTIPITTTPVNLQTAIGDVLRLGQATPCDHTYYDYSSAPPPDHFVYLPLVLKNF